MESLQQAQTHKHPLIGQRHSGFMGMGGLVIAADTVYGINHATGKEDILLTRLRIQATEDSPQGWFKSGTVFDAYISQTQ